MSIGERELPPSDRTEPEQSQASTAALPVIVKEADLDLMREVKAFQAERGLTQAEIAKAIGVSGASVSKWLNGKPEGDVEKLEDGLRFLMATEPERQNLRREVVPTELTRRVCKILRSVANTNDIAVITGPAGIGKSCGCQLFLLDFPTALYLQAGELHGGSRAMVDDVWEKSVARRRKTERGMTKNEVLKRRFKGTNRLIIIDDCHLLTAGGLRWVKSFHDATGCPIALPGNPNVLEKILRLPDEDQYTSRIGQNRKLALAEADSAELAGLLLEQYAPRLKAELLADATVVCSRRGYARRCKKQLRLALEILEGGVGEGKTAQAMRAAGQTEAQIAFSMAASQLLTLPEEA